MIGLDQDRMVQALNLTKAGRLAEATDLIQRTLGSNSPSGSSPNMDLAKLFRRTAKSREWPMASALGIRMPMQSPDLFQPQALPPGSLGAGVLHDRTYASGSNSGRYLVYVPPDLPSHGTPVVVMLHGGTQAVADYAAGTGMNRLADQHHFLVVYPEQSARANPMRYWNWFRPQDQRSGNGEPAWIAGITEQVISDYDADPDKTFIVGFSAGAAMAMVMAATYPGLYAAAGVHSGLPYAAAHDVPSAFALMRGASPPSQQDAVLKIPLIVFHGDHDEIVNVVNANHIRRQRLGIDGALIPADSPSVAHGQMPNGHAYTQTTYSNEGGVLLEQWIVHGAGHAWFGGTPGCSYTDPRGPDASVEMLRFFSEHGRRG